LISHKEPSPVRPLIVRDFSPANPPKQSLSSPLHRVFSPLLISFGEERFECRHVPDEAFEQIVRADTLTDEQRGPAQIIAPTFVYLRLPL
jgi:hypothetical protein